MLRLIAIGLCLTTTLLHSVGGCCWHHLQVVAAPAAMIDARPAATCCCHTPPQSAPVKTPQPAGNDEPVCHGDRCVYLTSPTDAEWRPLTHFITAPAAPISDSEHAPRTEEQTHPSLRVTAEAALLVRLARLQLWIL